MLTLRRATLIVDLDHLQGISRQHGDEASEELLHFAEWRIAATIGATGVVGALGRGTFKIALHKEVDEASVHRVSSRLHKFLRAPFTLRGREIFTSASIGIALGFAGADALERNAVDAVRRVKSNGGDATFLIRATVVSHPVAAA
jgi:GGDEF domain-containing protein